MLDPHKLALDCIIDAPPPCAHNCPLGVEVRSVMERARIGSFSAAYKVFAKSAVFPGIAAHICPRPCEQECVRSQTDEAIKLSRLEKFFYATAGEKKPMFIPDKKKSVLIGGGGIEGMAMAAKLAQRGYSVTLVEATHRLGGRLWRYVDTGLLPREVLEAEIASLADMKFLQVLLGTRFENSGSDYDAIIDCTGNIAQQNGSPAGHEEPGWVFVPEDTEDTPLGILKAIRIACDMSHAVEDYIKIGRVDKPKTNGERPVFTPNAAKITPEASRIQGSAELSTDDAKAEANRCIGCTCSNCVDACDMLQYYKKDPKKTILDVSDTINKTPIVKKSALRQIMSCTQCGLCTDVCPAGIDFKSICLESRSIMQGLGQLPIALYDFWLEDMAFSNGDEANITITPEGKEVRYLLFPGCQMGASDPEYVKKSYNWLKQSFPDEAGLSLGCCGAPAWWAGATDLHSEALEGIRRTWRELGKPTYVLPCPTCYDMFAMHLGEIETISLWELMTAHPLVPPKQSGTQVSVFDPCSSKYYPEMQQAVRHILENAGYELTELERSRNTSACCGYGGLIYTTNAELQANIQQAGANMGEAPYIAYCVNCRDNFAKENKPAVHLLDVLLFGDETRFHREPPDISLRRQNRRQLKLDMESEYLGMQSDSIKSEITLYIAPELHADMEKRLILQDDAIKVIQHAEESGKKILHNESGRYSAHHTIGRVTFWVEYEPIDANSYTLHSAYAHRMAIEE